MRSRLACAKLAWQSTPVLQFRQMCIASRSGPRTFVRPWATGSIGLGHAWASAERLGADPAERIDWIEADLATWASPAARYDLVICLAVHVGGPVEELVRRLAAGVAPSRDAAPGRPPAGRPGAARRRPLPARSRSPPSRRRSRHSSRSLGDPRRREGGRGRRLGPASTPWCARRPAQRDQGRQPCMQVGPAPYAEPPNPPLKHESPLARGGFRIAGAGFEPATFGL
ncbi:MAG: hypothetical protein QOG94_2452 [Solirubrobacteraceae bacterium]|nr:hypothetical protein [Solirubrobacteraceae bacterium]